jgi:hypothetical protein
VGTSCDAYCLGHSDCDLSREGPILAAMKPPLCAAQAWRTDRGWVSSGSADAKWPNPGFQA